MINPESSYDAAMLRRQPHVQMRAETATDAPFLTKLFVDVSPMAGMIPDAMLAQQAEIANAAFRANHPSAMYRIASIAGEPVGRIIIDWDYEGNSHGVDIAVLRRVQRQGLAVAMVNSWFEVADQIGCGAGIEVLTNNPARKTWQRLGWAPVAGATEDHPVTEMFRPAGTPIQT